MGHLYAKIKAGSFRAENFSFTSYCPYWEGAAFPLGRYDTLNEALERLERTLEPYQTACVTLPDGSNKVIQGPGNEGARRSFHEPKIEKGIYSRLTSRIKALLYRG